MCDFFPRLCSEFPTKVISTSREAANVESKAKKHLGFTGTQHNILETSSLLPGQDTGRHRAELVLTRLSKHMMAKTLVIF